MFTPPRELKRGATDGAANVERAPLWHAELGGPLGEQLRAPLRELERLARAALEGHHVGRLGERVIRG